MKKVLFIWRSGLKFYELFENYPCAIYDPKTGKLLYGEVKPDEKVIIVDDEVASGVTLMKIIKNLKLKDYEIASFSIGSFKVDVPLRQLPIRKPFLCFFGLPASGKSLIAHGFSKYLSAPIVKWGKFAKPYAGLYGEKLREIEEKDPFFLARKVYHFVKEQKYEDKVVILDNPKNEYQITFLSFVLRKPAIPICVEIDEEKRKKVLKLRNDDDDAYSEERDQLFINGIEKLKKHSVVVRLDANDHSEAVELLKRHGLYDGKGFYPNTLFYKPAILDFIYKVSVEEKTLPEDPTPEIPEHYFKHYEERYGRLVKDERKKKIAVLLSVAYRLIDDVLDEHETRLYHPAYHVEKSIFDAVYLASTLILHAKHLLLPSERREFLKMTKTIYEAVSLELELEITGRKPNEREYFKTLEREGAFRYFLYFLAGRDPLEGWKEGIKAQIEDDLKGSRKYGREDTEERLNRPSKYASLFVDRLATEEEDVTNVRRT